MASFTGDMYLTDQQILKLSINDAMTILHTTEYPWASFLGLNDPTYGGSDNKDYWMNSPEGLVQTLINMSGGMTGGSSEEITVDSTTNFVANNTIVIAENGALDIQVARISAIGTSTTMTIYPLSGSLSAHANDTPILLGGDWVKYGTTLDQPLRLPTRDNNTIEQISVSKDIPFNVEDARMLNNENVYAQLRREALDEFKQKVTMASLVGEEVTASGGSGKAKMDGLINLIPSANVKDDTAWSRGALRNFVSDLEVRGAFPLGEGLALVNPKANVSLYTFDDAATGAAVRTTDRPLNEVMLNGIRFRVMRDLAMAKLFRTDKERIFFLTPMYKGKKLVRLATTARNRGVGVQKEVLVTAVQQTLQVAAFCAFELIDPRRHGLWKTT